MPRTVLDALPALSPRLAYFTLMDVDSGADSIFPGDAKQGSSAGTGTAASVLLPTPGLRTFQINDDRFEDGELMVLFAGIEHLEADGSKESMDLINRAIGDLQAFGGPPICLD